MSSSTEPVYVEATTIVRTQLCALWVARIAVSDAHDCSCPLLTRSETASYTIPEGKSHKSIEGGFINVEKQEGNAITATTKEALEPRASTNDEESPTCSSYDRRSR